MKPEQHLELREKLSTQSAIAEHMTNEVAQKSEQIRTLESLAAARLARIEELAALLHPVTTGELNDVLAWVDCRLGQYEENCPAFERGELTLQTIRQAPERDNDDTAINVLATALRSELDTSRKLRGESAQHKARAEKAEAEQAARADAQKRGQS
jgi:hypothetical protein